jgi:uncharacterized OsmC-like protein
MATSHAIYLGDLRTKAIHLQSGTEIITDAPTDNHGKGEAFSPTDLLATSLGLCMMTTMGIVAKRHGWDLMGMNVEVTKVMSKDSPRRVTEIHIKFDFGGKTLDDEQQIILKNTALSCPVAHSLDPNIKQVVDFGF